MFFNALGKDAGWLCVLCAHVMRLIYQAEPQKKKGVIGEMLGLDGFDGVKCLVFASKNAAPPC
jgi:hypothetical protein